MESPRVLFLHGLESGPGGRKARALAEHFDALTPALDTRDFEACVAHAADEVRRFEADLVVGSSFGGGVALALLERGLWQGPTLLLAPAITRPGLARRLPDDATVWIVHGRHDDVVPIEGSRALAQTGSQDRVRLVEVDDDHRLSATLASGRLVTLVRELGAAVSRSGFSLRTYVDDPGLWLVLVILVAHLVIGLAWAIARVLRGGGSMGIGAVVLLVLLSVFIAHETRRPARTGLWLALLWLVSTAVAIAGVRYDLL